MAPSREIDKLQRRWQENPLGLTFAPLAEAYRKEGLYGEALELLDLGLAQHPAYVPAHIVCARCHADVGNDAQAEAAFRRVTELDPENVIALKGLAEIEERTGRLSEAVDHLEALLGLDRNNEAASAQLERVRDLLAMPTPGTIEPGGISDVSLAAPESSALSEVPAPVVAEPASEGPGIVADEHGGAERSHLGPEAPEAVVAADTGDAEEAAPTPPAATEVNGGVEAIDLEVDADLAEPEPAATWQVEEDFELTVREELADRRDRDLGVDVYLPVELEAAAENEYQLSSDSESLEGGRVEEVSDGGERVVPLFAASGGAGPRADATGSRLAEEIASAEPGPGAGVAEEAGDEPEAGSDEADEPEELELVVTETMAEIFLRQGHRELALAVYTQLHQREPSDERIRAAKHQLEAELQPGLTPALPAYAAALTGGQSVRSFLEGVLTAAVPEAGAGDELPLGAVFGDDTGEARDAEPLQEEGPSFDEFYASEPVAEPAPPAADPPAPAAARTAEDIEEFNAWLRGLKR